jgi:hypothetical protein
MGKLSFFEKIILFGSLFIAISTDCLLIWDIIQFHLKMNQETAIPMALAVPFFGFPLYVAIAFFVWKLTPQYFPYRIVFRVISISPFGIALLGGLTA